MSNPYCCDRDWGPQQESSLVASNDSEMECCGRLGILRLDPETRNALRKSRMRYLPIFCLLITTLGFAQQEQKPSDVPPEYQPPILRDKDDQVALPKSAANVSPEMAVITIKGLCEKQAPSSTSPCETVVTRAQFEKLTNALLPNMKPSFQLQVARGYPDLLEMAQAAEARGVDKTSRFQERLEFAR